MHVNTLARVRKRIVTGGEQPAPERKPRLTPPVPPKIDGKVEAHLIAIRTGPPPEGRTRWTLERIAGEAVRLAQKKPRRSPGRSSRGASRSGTTPGSSRRWSKSRRAGW